MHANSKLMTVINYLMTGAIIVIFAGSGSFIAISPDTAIVDMGLSILSDLGRSEVRVLGSVYLLIGLFAIFSCFKQQYLLDFYKIYTYIIVAILLGRMISFAHGNFDETVVFYTLAEIVLLGYGVYRLRVVKQVMVSNN